MNFSNFSRRIISAALVIAAAACADSIATAPSNDGYTLLNSAAFEHYKPHPDVDARAVVDGNGKTAVQVTTGDLSYFDPANRAIVPAVAGAFPLKKIHVKFCKEYKDFGLKQFSANFYWKEDALDKEDDGQPDSPVDPDDKAKTGVNWDRSAKYTTLTGSGDVLIPFTGIPAGVEVEIQANYLTPTGKVSKDGKVEYKDHEVKFCVPIEPTPDIAFGLGTGGSEGSISRARTFGQWVMVTSGSSIPVTANCAAYVDSDPTPIAVSAPITVAGTLSQLCAFPIKFASTGRKTLTFRLLNISPADGNASNNQASRFVDVGEDAPADGGGAVAFTMNPTIKETVTRIVTNPTADVSVIGADVPTPRDRITFGQDSKFIFHFDRLFTGDVRLIVTQSSDGRLIDKSDVTFASSAGCQAKNGDQENSSFPLTHTTAMSIEVCRSLAAGRTTITYDTYAQGVTLNGVNQPPVAGVFATYGSTIVYTVQVINTVGPKTWMWTVSHTAPIVYEYNRGTTVVSPKCNGTICFNQQTLIDYSRIGSAFGSEGQATVTAQQIIN